MANKEQKNRSGTNKPKLSVKERKSARRERLLQSNATVSDCERAAPARPCRLVQAVTPIENG